MAVHRGPALTVLASLAVAGLPALTRADDGLTVGGHVEAGITVNPAQPADSINYGNLFGDKANQLLLNQAMLDVGRTLEHTPDELTWGFHFQAMVGTDSRYTHDFGELQHLVHSRNQVDIVDADLMLSLPVGDGIDVRLGQFASPMGAEVIDATGNSLYSHSYIFVFGLPFKQVGGLAIVHRGAVDLYFGLDTGENGGWTRSSINNTPVKGMFGAGYATPDGELTLLALAHIGEDHPPIPDGRSGLRYIYDLTITWKASASLTFTGDYNYVADDDLGAIGYGAAHYVTLDLSDGLSATGRAEIWRDNSGAFVAAYPGYFDYVAAERGQPAVALSPGRATYGEVTLGLSQKISAAGMEDRLIIRPEIRFDGALNGVRPFNRGRDNHSVTPAVDAILRF